MKSKLIIVVFLLITQVSIAREITNLGKIYLNENPDYFSNVEVVEKQDLDTAKLLVPDDAIENAVGVDLKTRGFFGIQQDLSIRGMGFEQNAVMIDGVSLNDPQTGHFNLDLPLTIYDWDKIEIMRGGSSSLYGSNAMGGAVNFITAKPEKDVFKFKSLYGQKQLHLMNFSWDTVGNLLNSHLSFERAESASYRPETDFEKQSFFSKLIFNELHGMPELIIAQNKKDFGAASFYSSNYPCQEEHTTSGLYMLNFRFHNGNRNFSPKFYYRRHWDRFILDRTRPDWFKNIHINHLAGFKLPWELEIKRTKLNLGLEYSYQDIRSTNLGSYTRDEVSLFCSVKGEYFEKFNYDLSLRIDDYSKYDLQISPGLFLGYSINNEEDIFLSIQRNYRLPSFTELYYSSPANVGNSDLLTEECFNFEVGYKKEKEEFSYGTSFFRRFGYDLIDWVKNSSNDAWRVENVSYSKTDGVEAWLKWGGLKFSYSYLDSDYKSGAEFSKYIADYMKHKVALSQSIRFKNIMLSFDASYQKRPVKSGFFNLDLYLRKNWLVKEHSMNLFLGASNLTNSKQEDIEGVALAGRWIYSGCEITF